MVVAVARFRVVFLNPADYFRIPAFKTNAEEASARLTQGRQQFQIRTNIGPAIGVEAEFVTATNQLLRQLHSALSADDEGVVLKHDRLYFGHLVRDEIELVRDVVLGPIPHGVPAESLRINTERTVIWAASARVENHERPQRVAVKIIWHVQEALVDFSHER